MPFRSRFIALVCLLGAFASAQQPSALPLLKAADLQADAAVLQQAYATLHPGLYRYNTKSQMDARFAQLKASLNHDQTLQDAYLTLSTFAAQIKCGHTYANFFNQYDAVANQLFKTPTRVPFYFTWLDRQMIVTTDFTPDHQLPRGTEVLAINNIPTPEILARLLTIARADGSNDAKRIASLNLTGADTFESFDIFFPLFFPQTSPSLALTVLKPSSAKPDLIHVAALTYEQRIAPIQSQQKAKNGGTDPQFEWRYLPDGSAWLRMPDWALFNSKWDWKTWLNTHLDELADTHSPALIIDLRHNEGGLDVGNLILSRLVRHDLPLTQSKRLVRYRKIPADLAPYLDTWDPSFKDWSTAALDLPKPWPTAPHEVPYLALKRSDDVSGQIIKAEGKPYLGRVAVLVDSSNSSATFQFAQLIQQTNLGTLIGEPTGGSQRGINGGAFFFLRLPHSHIELDLPLIATFPPQPAPDAGLTPDILVRPSATDIAQGNDVVLAAASRFLHENHHPNP